MRGALVGGTAVKVVYRNRWADVLGSPLFGRAGEVIGVPESSRDITEHLRLTELLKGQGVQLAHLAQHDASPGCPTGCCSPTA